MTETPAKQRPLRHWLLRLVALAALAVLAWFASICLAIVRQASQQEVHPADAIVVFGAAEYAGRPSPVYRARLDHAFDLFKRGVAPVVITTGGAGADPSFSEGGVGHDYLMKRGIPEANVIAETQGSDTARSAERVGVILRTNHMRSCIAVSDEYHVFRIQKLLEHEGVQVYVAPRPDSRPHSVWQRALAVAREAVGYLAWRLHIPA
ncbi:MAG: YdcF family protein [Acidobacteriia bacterium]|nr:YdcF family protein [Terriglobia bacterium]